MKTKKQLKIRVTAADAAMPSKAKPRAKRSNQSPTVASRVQPNGADKVAKFKDGKHLKIETRDLGQDEVELDAEKAVPLSSTSKKRRRRSAAEIDRKYKCPFTGCLKAYGSEGSLIHHQKLKHPERVDRKEKDNQVGTFLLPLHNAPRNVMIRPATPLVALTTDRKLLLSNQSTNDMNALVSSLDIVPLSAKALRRNMRSRSNSEPVAFIEEQAIPKVCIPPAVVMTKLLPKNPRKSRRVVTPRAKMTATIARRTKLRSHSESLPEMNPFQSLNELKIPSYYRSDSSASAHETVLPISCTGSIEHGSFEWPAASISASHHSTSLSSDEQAIDSDILSVLANCDVEQSRDSSGINFGGGPPLTDSYQSSTRYKEIKNTDMLSVGMECFKIAENATLPAQVSEGLVINEPEAELGLKAFTTLGEDWTNALLLSDHLKKMSVAQGDTPPHSLVSTFGKVMPSVETVHRLRPASDGVHVLPGLSHFSSVPLDTFSVNTTMQLRGENGLAGQHNVQPCTSKVAKMEDGGIQQMLWLSSEADVASVSHTQPSSVALDQLLRHDDTLEWKPTDVFDDDKEGESGLADTGVTPALL